MELKYCLLDIQVVPETHKSEKITQYLISKNVGSLHPFFSKIVLIGLKEKNAEPLIYFGEEEADILRKCWKHLKDFFSSSQPKPVIVTFNGYRFDIPFLYIRSAVNNIACPITINTNIWNMEGSNHLDLMQFLSYSGLFPFISLEIACEQLGIPMPSETIRGDEIYKYYQEGEWERILEHSKRNLLLLEGLYQRLFGIPVEGIKVTKKEPETSKAKEAELATQEQRDTIYKLTKALGIEPMIMAHYLKREFGITSSKQLTKEQAEHVIGILVNVKSAGEFKKKYLTSSPG